MCLMVSRLEFSSEVYDPQWAHLLLTGNYMCLMVSRLEFSSEVYDPQWAHFLLTGTMSGSRQNKKNVLIRLITSSKKIMMAQTLN